jgi:hypothetical protein
MPGLVSAACAASEIKSAPGRVNAPGMLSGFNGEAQKVLRRGTGDGALWPRPLLGKMQRIT